MLVNTMHRMNTLLVLGQPFLRRSTSSISQSGPLFNSFPLVMGPAFTQQLQIQQPMELNSPLSTSLPWYKISDGPPFQTPPPLPSISELGEMGFPCVDSSQIIDSILDLNLPSESSNDEPILAVKRTYQPSVIRKKRQHGFLVRMRDRHGRNTINRRRRKGRSRLAL